jgi:hypothetical protein
MLTLMLGETLQEIGEAEIGKAPPAVLDNLGFCLAILPKGECAMAGPPSMIVGRIVEIGPTYIVLGTTRIELQDGKMAEELTVGQSVTVEAVAVDGKYVARSIKLNPDQGSIGGGEPSWWKGRGSKVGCIRAGTATG